MQDNVPPPIGYMVPLFRHGMLSYSLYSGKDWLVCEGDAFDPVEYPELEVMMRTDRPVFQWMRPFKTRRKIREWDEGHIYVYGGKQGENVNLPDLRAHVVSARPLVPVPIRTSWWKWW